VFVDVPGLSQTLTIPAGKTADVMIYFCGETRTKTLMTVRAVVVGSGIASPPFMQVRELTPAGQLISQCANFYRMKMTPPAAGPLTVKIQWHGAGGALQEMRNRSMILVVNYH
jgi:hypothetical protein